MILDILISMLPFFIGAIGVFVVLNIYDCLYKCDNCGKKSFKVSLWNIYDKNKMLCKRCSISFQNIKTWSSNYVEKKEKSVYDFTNIQN